MLQRWVVVLAVVMAIAVTVPGSALAQRASASRALRIPSTPAQKSIDAAGQGTLRSERQDSVESLAATRRVRAAFVGALAGAIIGGYVAADLETSDCPRERSCVAGAGATFAGIAIGAVGGATVGVLAHWAWTSLRPSPGER
jgi:hypothetical protein